MPLEADPPRSPGHRYAPLAGPRQACWDPSGERLAVLVRDGIAVLAVGDPEVRLLRGSHADARAIAWSRDGAALAIACEERDVQRLVRVADGAELWRASIGVTAVDEVLWSPDGRHIAFVDDELVVCAAGTGAALWRRSESRTRSVAGVAVRGDVERPRLVEHVRFERDLVTPDEALWSPDAELLAVRWGDIFRVFTASDGAVKTEGAVVGGVLRWGAGGQAVLTDGAHRLAHHTSRIVDRRARTLCFSRDGRRLAAEGDNHRLWVQDEHGVQALDGHPRTIKAIAWSASGALATACRDGLVRRWSPGDPSLQVWARLTVEDGGLSWSPDGAHLAACCADSVVLVSAGSGEPVP